MAGKLIPLAEAASLLGVSPERLNELRQNNEIYGYRDGASWKFKQDEVERLKDSFQAGTSGAGSSKTSFDDLDFSLPDIDEKDDLMVAPDLGLAGRSDVSLGHEPMRDTAQADSNLHLSDDPLKPNMAAGRAGHSDLGLASDILRDLAGSSDVKPTTKTSPLSLPALDGAGNDDDELVLGGPLEGDVEPGASKTVIKSGSGLFGSGPIQLGGENVLDAANLSFAGQSSIGLGDDHDHVLGGSGSGSDITHRPGDSGILLIDPADSGLSLEAPPALSGARLSDETTDFQVGAEDDFLLKPLDEGSDDDSESGSQVIMLDSEGAFDDKSSTLIADSLPGMPGGLAMDYGSPLGAAAAMSGGAAPAAVIPPGMVVVPKEAPFGMFAVTGLVLCTFVLAVGGMMMFDLMRNIWSWDSPYAVSSTIMDSLTGS